MSEAILPIVDNVRASRDGHEFHEAWAARTALELVPPDSNLASIAIEGFAKNDVQDLSSEAHDIADLVRYRGGDSFDTADWVETVQFKYSIAKANEPMTSGAMTKTLSKFATTEADIDKKWGDAGLAKARFELVTNRPIDSDVLRALEAIRTGTLMTGRIKNQAATLIKAIGLQGDQLAAFARRLSITGTGGSLAGVDHSNLATLSSWSGTTDSVTKLRLGNLRKLVRKAAGGDGQGSNRLVRVDILGALGIAREGELYPVATVFPPVANLIDREVMPEIIDAVLAAPRPLLLHAAGGFGKTVAMQAIARYFEERDDLVLLFDGFGAGEWRNPSDARHLPHKALLYLANLLAAKGLCDILIAGSHVEDLISGFRERLIAAVKARRQFKPDSRIVLLLDAADHAGMQAERTKSISFAHLLLHTLSISPIDGVIVAASCRSHRRIYARGEAQCREFEIPAFTTGEIARLVGGHIYDATAAELIVLENHSRGNPRLLDGMLRRGRPFDREAAPADAEQGLKALLTEQIEHASDAAVTRGARQEEIRGLLAGLALLPPPVPIDELAAALAIERSEIEGFVADLFPLIAVASTGLIFRDEPTETLVSDIVNADGWAQDDLLLRLEQRQSASIYAARALPVVLTQLDRVDALVALAFVDQPVRPDLSKVADRAIKAARIKAAAIASARSGRVDELTQIALEASRISSATERSDAFLRDYPDIVGVSADEESMRRLRDDRTMWNARRHGVLAVLDIFQGNRDSALLEAERAISWINRNFRLLRDKDPSAIKDHAEPISSALFIELLEGKAERIERFLRQYYPTYAYRVASRIIALTERLAQSHGKQSVAPALEILRTCRSKSPAIVAASLETKLLTKETKKRLICRLAELKPDLEQPMQIYKRDRNFDLAVHAAAGQAASLGMKREALAILGHAPDLNVRSHAFSDPLPHSGELGDFLRVAAIRRVIRNRPTTLLDVAPVDMLEAVPISTRTAGPSKFSKAINKLIDRAQNPQQKRRQPKITNSTAQEWLILLSKRITPIQSMVDMTASILTDADPNGLLIDALLAAKKAFQSAEDYPLRGQRRFLAKVPFELYRWATTQRGALNAAGGRAIADYLKTSDIDNVLTWTETIRMLAECPECHAIALELTKAAEQVITADTEIVTQVNAYGALSVALWPLSTEEASHYFKKGLELADGVGSDDQERIGELLAFAANYDGAPLSRETVHRLSRLVDLNLPDEAEKFDWAGVGKAYALIDGPRSLAFLTRLVDRDRVGLGTTLPPLLKSLVEEERLDATLAAGVAFLDPFSSYWDWRTPAFARPIMKTLTPAQRIRFADEMVIELDRSDATYTGGEALASYASLFADMLPPAAAARRRIECWMTINARLSQPSSPSPISLPDGLTELLSVSPVNAEKLEQLIEAELDTFKGNRPTSGFILHRWADAVVQPAHRTNLLAAVMAIATLKFGQKLSFLSHARDAWAGQSLALDARISAAVHDLSLRHVEDVIAAGDEWRRPINRVARIAGDSAPAVVSSLITSLSGHNLAISSAFWLTSARVLACGASSAAIAKALDRFTRQATDMLPPAIGDGPWSPAFEVPDTPTECIASLIWLRLGSPDADSRWRAAHAVRRLCGYGRTDILELLIRKIDSQDAGAFQDRKLPFFNMHAKLWLLIAIARIALDDPAEIAKYRALLTAVATNTVLPHALMRHFSIAALRACISEFPSAEQTAASQLLDNLEWPKLAPVKWSGHRPNAYAGRPAGQTARQSAFRFDYDFSKYQLDPLGEVFALATWRIEDIANAWVRRWDGTIRAMWDCPRPGHRNHEHIHDGNQFTDSDFYGGYLGRHALFCAAGELADTQPVAVGRYYDEVDPWRGWIESLTLSRTDNLWLADGLDLFPLNDAHPIVERGKGNEKRIIPEHPLALLELAGITDDLVIPERICVAGSWESHDELSVKIGSRLVEPCNSRIASHALQSAPPGYAFFPHVDGQYSPDDRPPSIFQKWLTDTPENYAHLDGQDPYGCKTAIHRRGPMLETTMAMKVAESDPFGRAWKARDGRIVFEAQAWGTARGRGRSKTERSGTRIDVTGTDLQMYLADIERDLILHVCIRKHLDNKEWGEKAYRQLALTCIVRADGSSEPIWSLPKRISDAVKQLDPYDRGEFDQRYDLIAAMPLPRRLGWPRHRARRTTRTPS